jgi:hypothetical protein
MKILILDSRQVRELLPMPECIELMADAKCSNPCAQSLDRPTLVAYSD